MNEWTEILENLAALGCSVVLGGLVGLERELRGRWAGLRTHMLVSLGATLFVLGIASATRGDADAISRLAQGLVAGIGFLGAGTILKLTEKDMVKGLTTASSIWVAAGVGMACGLKLYPLAVGGAVIALVVLEVLRYLEVALDRAAGIDPDSKQPEDKGNEEGDDGAGNGRGGKAARKDSQKPTANFPETPQA
jgi:putative Mg2+ transporter-C (MgtC) family protein